MIVTIGNHANGDTGLNVWIRGFSAVYKVVLKPQTIPIGMAIKLANKNPVITVTILVSTWSKKVGLPV